MFLFLLYNPENEALCCDRGSRVVQRKIPGPTTEKPVDGNHLLLKPCLFLQRLPPFFFSLSLSVQIPTEHLSSLAAQSHSFQVPTQSNHSRHRPPGCVRSQSAGREQLCKLTEALGRSWAVPFLTSVVPIISSSLHWRVWTLCLKKKRRPSTGHPSGQRK